MEDILKRQLLRQRIENPSEQERDFYSYKFALFTANMKRYLPVDNMRDYEKLFKKFLYYVQINKYDQYDFEKLDTLKINGWKTDIFENNNANSCIFCTFHFGSYRLIHSFLANKGLNIVTIVEDKAYYEQKDEIDEALDNFKKFSKKNDTNFVLLNVKNTASIFQLKKLLSEGYVSVVYMDGNTGVKQKTEIEKEGIEIDFLRNKFFVRKGILELAYIVGASIVPVISEYTNNDKIVLHFFNKINPTDYKKRSTFVEFSLHHLYLLLERFVAAKPEQWECWTYLQKWFVRNEILPYTKTENLSFVFNNQRYGLFKIINEYYLFDLFSYFVFNISENDYNSLKTNNINKIEKSELSDFINANVII